jgi:hypothetical protein
MEYLVDCMDKGYSIRVTVLSQYIALHAKICIMKLMYIRINVSDRSNAFDKLSTFVYVIIVCTYGH